MIEPFGATYVGTRAGLIALDVALKVAVLIGIVYVLHYVLGRSRALVRSALWNACLIGLLLIPAADLALPRLIITVPVERPIAPEVETIRRVPSPAVPLSEEGPSPTPALFAPEALEPLPLRTGSPSVQVPVPVRVPTPRRIPRPGGIDIALAAYLAGASLLAIRLMVSCLAVARLRREGSPIDDARWSGPLGRLRVDLGIGRHVAVLASSRLSVPVVVGWLRPAVIIPARLAEQASPTLIDAVLLHELGHVRRGDFGWNLVRKIAQLVYWPHPLVWPLGRIIERVREQACDDLCVHGLGGSAAYRDSLIEVASNLVRRPDSALGLAMARPATLVQRLAWIDRTRGASRCLLRWPGRISVALAVTIAAGFLGSIEFARAAAKAASEEQKAEAVPDQPAAVEVTIRAKDTGKPLEGARLKVYVDLQHILLKSDREGRVRIDLSHQSFQDILSIDVWAEGYVQQRYRFAQNDARYKKFPTQVVIDLLPGEQTLGGKVVDEQGKPIAGVVVDIWGYLGEKKQKEELASMVDATTDDQGQWRCRSFRSMQFAYLYLKHPDYLSDDPMHARRHGRPTPSDPPLPDDMPLAALRDFSDVQVMTRGVSVSGEVRGDDGKPIAGAEVAWLDGDQFDSSYQDLPKAATDEAGRFRFPHARPGRLVLQVKAQGHAPELRTIDAKAGAEGVAIKLGKPRTLEGRVVDSKGQPIPDALVVIDSWRSYRSLGVYLKSGADGVFRWEDAPPETVLVNAAHAGFESVSFKKASPDEKALLTLKRSLTISGWVRDAKTNKLIESPIVELGIPDSKSRGFTWRDDNGVFAHQGTLQGQVDVERSPEFRLRIRAKGYEPFESSTFHAGDPESELNVRLNPTDKPDGVVLSGVVQAPDGSSLAGAEVAITYPMTSRRDRLPTVHIQDGKLQTQGDLAIVKTDAAGRFHLIREPDPAGRYFAVVVVHPRFFAEVDRAAFEANATIVAKPWGRIEGVARIGSKPASGATIRSFADRLGNPDTPSISSASEQKADARGIFVIERAITGDVRVSIASGDGDDYRSFSYGMLVEVSPGETARAELGGKGRPVIARIAPPPGFDPKADYVSHSQFSIESDRPTIPYPRQTLASRDGASRDWIKNWWVSAEGHEYRSNFFRFSQAKLQPDGSIRVEDVPAGEYRLNLSYCGEAMRGIFSTPERIAHATKQFTIPPITGGRSDEPYDLGTLHPKPRQTLKVGQPAPSFDVETLDGGRVKLEDFRGKYLLLDFWATWCGPCVAQVPDLKSLHERFGKDERFAMLSLSLDVEKEAPRQFVADKGLSWKQGFLGEGTDNGPASTYHVTAIPSMFLIAPDGTVKAIDPSGDSIAAAVSEALKSRR
ncbi:carboxypeptidase regulatory-like domain-containing protein [Singulisphaera sp. PoT]|uniref:carboxypeptidase regulatory-like domain-containing protein n=1 Tax=Singulisphaera sp. PoT TaxID=3411797 RepID=UPI003BF46A11